jgi:hypothetical protein
MQAQEQDFAAWADLQVEELREEQQQMRRRAEKRWRVLDEAYEARIQARNAEGTQLLNRLPCCAFTLTPRRSTAPTLAMI